MDPNSYNNHASPNINGQQHLEANNLYAGPETKTDTALQAGAADELSRQTAGNQSQQFPYDQTNYANNSQHAEPNIPRQQQQPPSALPHQTNHHIPPLIDRSASYQPDSPIDTKINSPFSSSPDADRFAMPRNSSLGDFFKALGTRYQLLLDWSTPHVSARWTFSLAMLLLFMVRIVMSQGFYIVCYGLSLYYLSLFISFLSPKIDPAFQHGGEFSDDLFYDDNDSATGPMLPTSASQEFKPFMRRLPEFKFWLEATRATLISLFMTMFEIFDIPVFWPILFIYFVLLFVSTMRQQIRHMWRYKYVPWTRGKRRYGGNQEDSAKLYPTVI